MPGDEGLFNASTRPSVSTMTGQIAFTLTPDGPSSFAKDWVRPFMPNFVAQYAELFLLPLFPAILEILIIVAPSFITLGGGFTAPKSSF